MTQFLDRWFLSDSIPLDLCITYYHDKWLVMLSYVVAAFASYTAFHLLARVRSAANDNIRTIWLVIAGTSMGCGIFSMHFIAMLAVHIPVPVHYDPAVTALSALFAIGASGVAFHFASRQDRGFTRLFIGAVILGSGIGLMHYTGDLALRMPARIYYDPKLFALSVLVAVGFSMIALWVLRASDKWRGLSRSQTRLAGALVMGLAITVMHYTGNASASLFPDFESTVTGVSVDSTLMAVAIGIATFLISSIAISGALLDRRAEVAEARRQQSESFLQTIIDNSADGILTFDENQIVQSCNPASGRIFHHETAEILGERIDRLVHGGVTLAMAMPNTVHRSETCGTDADRASRFIEYTVNDMHFAGRRMFNCVVRDITEYKRAEDEKAALKAKLQQSQKLESLGTLAGGIAHEFNNMPVPISGLTELAMRDVTPESRAHRNMSAVLVNSRRAAQLVEKILSFAREEDSARTAIDFATVLGDAVELLNVTSPATITIKTQIDRQAGRIMAGEIQIHQVLMNLASNARHAMEGKIGELTISLASVDLVRGFEGRFSSLKPGAYAKLSVSDTGHGMDMATMDRIFEPFFTTKNVGKGTGLGLAVIHGIVTGHGGAIEVTSAPNQGTTFDIYLPRIEEAAPPVQAVA